MVSKESLVMQMVNVYFGPFGGNAYRIINGIEIMTEIEGRYFTDLYFYDKDVYQGRG